ncbi:MAG TPA: zinc-ribbon domain containing protein, partial [Dehalococcoidia bacterium]|nr:zinc-ribbon domain containing protein [Dehalococcoidia bacterium]
MPFVDRTLTCQNCGSSFTFTAEDQEFFEQKGFTEPRRCMPCRQQRRAERGESSYSPRTSERRE